MTSDSRQSNKFFPEVQSSSGFLHMYNIFGHVELMNISYLAEKQFISMILCSIQNKVLRHSSTSSMFLLFS